MSDVLIRKLETFVRLAHDEKAALCDAACRVREFGAREDVIREGDPTDGVNLVLDGFACRYKTLEDGRRQLLSWFIPGDLCDLRVFVLERMDHSIGTLAPTTLATLPREAVLALTERFPTLTRALWWCTLVEEAISREWLMNLGQRTAYERTAHLFCEMFHRYDAVGLAPGRRFAMPVTQLELADTLGLSAVHVNRTLQELRRDGLIVHQGGEAEVLDLSRLEQAALFDPAYLHLGDRDRDRDGRRAERARA